MIREELVEGVVKSYNFFKEKLFNLLKDEKLEIEKTNRSLIALKENRNMIRRIFKDNPSLKVYKPEIRELIKEVRNNNDPYINLIERLAENIFESLKQKKIDTKQINHLFEGLKYTPPLYTIQEGLPILQKEHRPPVSEDLIQRIQIDGTSDLLEELIEQIIKESPEDYSEDWLNEFADQYDLPNFPLRRIEAGAIIHSREIPSKIMSLFNEMRDCYMFGLYNATIIFCRAILEESLKQFYKNTNPNTPMERIGNLQLNELLEKVNLPEEFNKEARKVKNEANRILHKANIQNTSGIQEKALSVVRSTTLVVEKLFLLIWK